MNRRAFCVLGVLIGLAAVAACNKPPPPHAAASSCRMQLNKIATGILTVAASEDYPTDLRQVLEHKTGIKERHLKDPWGMDLVYTYPATRNAEADFDLCSNGPDGVAGNADDICYQF